MGRGMFDRLEGELEARERSPGLRMSDLLTLPEPQSGLLRWMIRQVQVGPEDVIAFLGGDEQAARALLAELCDQGFVREIEIRSAIQYRVRLAPKRGRTMTADLWRALDDKVEHGTEDQP
jgi:hypothetical protein